MKTLAERHDDLRQTCVRVARHMKMVAEQDRKDAVSEESKTIRDLKTANARYLDEEAETLVKAAEEGG
jgi:hypothetical protein